MNRTKATITGVQSVIDQIDSIGIPVDVSQIQGTVKKFIDVPISGNYQVIPKTVSAQVTPVFKKSETSSTNHSSSSTTGAAGNSSDSSRSSEMSTDTQATSSQEESTNQSAN